nr:MAG TPA: hypothetical protein [Caudoviricetes sp.]
MVWWAITKIPYCTHMAFCNVLRNLFRLVRTKLFKSFEEFRYFYLYHLLKNTCVYFGLQLYLQHAYWRRKGWWIY